MLGIYLLIAALSFLALYFAVKKLTLNIDEQTLLEPIKMDLYPKFCDLIDEKIRQFKENVQNTNLALKNSDQKDEFLEKLGDLSRELTFIQTMNLSNKNDSIWQNELFSFLKELENLLLEYLEKGEEEAENLREFLMNEFEKLKG
ncbi:hypothetical protein CV484_03950 [Campylobacter jejuni subsp. jejuni]|uniref:hypothetical protein n=1 Tax=Campylobacter jejuni TaxID=197 RepID=UPI000C28BA9E|nr:hypothetical protein [Campylobacter jejuni]PJP43051.1 hypothetical protein CV484_03950 [Campylobacter jejuni subsp. jejuni]PJP53780.1 hypothetical protein CV384_01275 [Campylobacter jejuni subsp. jejuni]PJP61269.1 hypothetical protein CV373_05690 [Campylobacter jejuni subsp. jejuni]PJP66382.1 hypothetical protein CV445_06280 [Campylobacter jejuni subsp. jejuni]PJP73480.1 hypothetical protein CV416_02675 [Campylobacter jejuni subsp. jejuni]